MLNNSDTLRRLIQVVLNLQPRSNACWTAQLLSAFQGLRGRELYVRAVQTGHDIPMQEFYADLKHRMRSVRRDAELVDPNTHNNKLVTYQSWFATPFLRNEHMQTIVPWYLHLDLSKHIMRHVSRLRLLACAYFESWGSSVAWRWFLRMWPMSWWRWTCSEWGACSFILPRPSSLWAYQRGNISSFCLRLFLRTFQQPNPFCCNRSTANLFINSFLSRTLDLLLFFLSLWIYLWLAETSQQPISQTTWLKVIPHCKHFPISFSRWDVVCLCIHWVLQNTSSFPNPCLNMKIAQLVWGLFWTNQMCLVWPLWWLSA